MRNITFFAVICCTAVVNAVELGSSSKVESLTTMMDQSDSFTQLEGLANIDTASRVDNEPRSTRELSEKKES